MAAIDVVKGWGVRFLGSRNERVLKGYRKHIAAIASFESELEALSDDALKTRWQQLRELWQDTVTDAYLCEGFAIIREASKRSLGMRHFDVQLMGGMALHQGKVAEMSTGEGKTLAATLPACLNALSGRGVHVVTVNPYLAKRDADWMRPLYDFLGLSVGVIIPEMSAQARQEAYQSDVVYATNNELGFDYLRDNMAIEADERVQRDLYYIIIDEVDSILIDEARTPLIISGPVEEDTTLFHTMDALAKVMEGSIAKPSEKPGQEEEPTGDFIIDEKDRQVHLTERGHEHAENVLREQGLVSAGESLYDVQHVRLLYYLVASLRARYCYQKDVAYIIQNKQVVIIDEHTGRSMPGRRWGDGLHQAIEAKEGLAIQADNQTLASITFQNFFRQYERLSGMTGTADTEAYELQQIYGLEVVVIPTHLPMVRQDFSDQVFVTKKERYAAIVDGIKTRHKTGQPVLVGTASIASSEHLSALLQKEGIKHHVLNAKHHSKEADIIAQAGCLNAVTIATNMAGRGTDIVLGGSKEAKDPAVWQKEHDAVLALGGLHVIGAERHESRRIDNQLRGRSGRQGDPGSSQFYLSLEDDLMRIFAGEWVRTLMRRMGMKEGEPLAHPMLSRSVESAQRKVEGHHFDIRKQLLQFDNIANDQRQLVYAERRILLDTEDLMPHLQTMLHALGRNWVAHFLPDDQPTEQWDSAGLHHVLQYDCGIALPEEAWQALLAEDDIEAAVLALLDKRLAQQQEALGEPFLQVARFLILQHLDMAWRNHLVNMDHLRQGIHLRGYAQKDPIQEYKREAFELFQAFLKQVKHASMAALLTVELEAKPVEPAPSTILPPNKPDAVEGVGSEPISRNSPCPCGSGLKYKHCHGKIT